MHVRSLIFCIAVAVSSGVAVAAPPFKVMSLNVRFDANPGVESAQENAWLATSGEHRRDLVLRVIADCDPDLLCVQEALTNQIQDIQSLLTGHAFYGVGRDDGKQEGEYCGIYFRRNRFESREQGTFWLNEKSDMPGSKFPKTCCARIATWVVLRDRENDDAEFIFLNTHWDHEVQEARVFSAHMIRNRLKSLAEGRPCVVAGDFNAKSDNRAIQTLLKPTSDDGKQLFDSFRQSHPQVASDEATFHGFHGNVDGGRIDYVLHSQGFRTLAADIVRTHVEARYPSDHFPVTATLVAEETAPAASRAN